VKRAKLELQAAPTLDRTSALLQPLPSDDISPPTLDRQSDDQRISESTLTSDRTLSEMREGVRSYGAPGAAGYGRRSRVRAVLRGSLRSTASSTRCAIARPP
jgi:hypothetical protein